jgi:transposase
MRRCRTANCPKSICAASVPYVDANFSQRGRLVTLRGRASSKVFSNAVRTVSLEHADGPPLSIDVMLQTFDHLSEQIARIGEQIAAATKLDAVCQRLMGVPGVGALVAMAFTTHVDDAGRFGSSDQLASYLALVPGESSTGGKTVRTRTIKDQAT